MNKLTSPWRWALAGLLMAFSIVVGVLGLFHTGPRPMCHKAIEGAFLAWMLETGRTNAYPNSNGNGTASLVMIRHSIGNEIQHYAYVPGLGPDDPKDLVLMYMRQKTHHTWHGDSRHTIFSTSRWMVLPPEIVGGTCPEGGTLVDTPEFKRRLLLTLAFLKEKQRPYWQAVADEQMEFLQSIKE